VLRAAGETTESTQENIQDWLQLDEGDSGFQLLTEEEIAAVFFNLFHQHYLFYYTFHLFVFEVPFCLLGLSFAPLIRIIG
jgi:hypothetical protein